MKILLTQSGGVAGLSLASRIDTETLEKGEARRVEALVRKSGLEKAAAAPRTEGRDLMSYRITIEEDGKKRSFELDTSVISGEVSRLIEYLERHAVPSPPE